MSFITDTTTTPLISTAEPGDYIALLKPRVMSVSYTHLKWLDDAKKNFASAAPSATPTFASAATQQRLRLAGNN